MLNAYFAGFEIVELLILAVCVRHALRSGRPAIGRLMAGIAYGLLLELITIYGFRSYVYGEFTLMVGAVPLVIGIAWTNQLYAARLFSDATSLPKWVRPVFEAMLIIYIDLLMEPVATRLGFWEFAALWRPGLGFWDFAGDQASTWFGAPYPNFLGFFWIVAVFSATMRLMEGAGSRFLRYLAPLAAVTAGSIAILLVNVMAAFVSNATRNAVTAGVLVGALLLVLGFRPRLVRAPAALAWQFLLSREAFFLGIGLVSGALVRPRRLLVVAVLICAAGLFAFLRSSRALHRSPIRQ